MLLAKIKTKVIFDVHTLRTCCDNRFKHTYTHTHKRLQSNNCEPLDILQVLQPNNSKFELLARKMPRQEAHTLEYDCTCIQCNTQVKSRFKSLGCFSNIEKCRGHVSEAVEVSCLCRPTRLQCKKGNIKQVFLCCDDLQYCNPHLTGKHRFYRPKYI